VADAWLPRAGRIPVTNDGGALKGGAPRVVWLTSEHDPRTVSARSVGKDLARTGETPHLIWSPYTGEIIQLLPATRAARLLPPQVGTEGRVCLQIMAIALARHPFTNSPLKGLEEIMRWLDSWGIPRRWPAGPPLSFPHSYQSPRLRRPWARGGHFGGSQVPVCVRPDPGALDIRRITGPDTPLADIPRPRIPASGESTSPAPPPPYRPRRLAEPALTSGA
jgi:hypothetical protein